MIWLIVPIIFVAGFLIGLWLNISFLKKHKKRAIRAVKKGLNLTKILEDRIEELERL